MKVAIVAIAKNERNYLDEWLKYHTELGVDKFFIVNNNDIPVEDEYVDDLEDQRNWAAKYNVQFFQIYGQDALTFAGKQAGVYNSIYQRIYC